MKNLKKFEAKAVKNAEAVKGGKGGKQDPLLDEWNEVLDESIGNHSLC